ncbi:unnamed protein product [Cuscuta europaea]|uniref:Uncharacterized protein n=1 Tax=Cuscuta europaea TaxID=41803 RepID=A0A9P0ZDX2_CUSEU|nr:unnamed protein product [Cuscuta europaea]
MPKPVMFLAKPQREKSAIKTKSHSGPLLWFTPHRYFPLQICISLAAVCSRDLFSECCFSLYIYTHLHQIVACYHYNFQQLFRYLCFVKRLFSLFIFNGLFELI